MLRLYLLQTGWEDRCGITDENDFQKYAYLLHLNLTSVLLIRFHFLNDTNDLYIFISSYFHPPMQLFMEYS